MKDLYEVAGITKQAIWKYRKRGEQINEVTMQVVNTMEGIRKRHKRMGCRKMYHASKGNVPVGRDIFEKIGLSNGFRVKRRRNEIKTTWSQRIEVYPNLMEGKVLNGINQAWQSDMFYLKVEGKTYYGVTIIDVYSRKLLALHVSKSLAAQQLGIAMRKALRTRTGHNLQGCIFHSDRGSQYISAIHKMLVAKNEMRISMCLLPQENAYAERVQGILKDGYLEPFDLKENNLRYVVPRIIRYYNQERPHQSLNNISPNAFEDQIVKLAYKSRLKMPIYQWDHEKLTKSQVINKKKKEAKKKKSTQIIPILEI